MSQLTVSYFEFINYKLFFTLTNFNIFFKITKMSVVSI